MVSFKSGDPQWDLFPLSHIKDFPAVQWKLYNIRGMSPAKRAKALEMLQALFK